MAVELLSKVGGDSLASAVGDFWTRWNTSRLVWLDRATNIQQYIESNSTNDTEVSRLAWKNNTTIPKLTQIYDEIHAYYMAAIFSDEDWFIFEGSSQEADVKGNVIQQYLRAKLRDTNFEMVVSDLLSDWIIYGTCFATVTWDVEKSTDFETGEEYIRFQGPRAHRLSPRSSMVSPRARNFDETPFISRSVRHIGELQSISDKFENIEKLKELRAMNYRDIVDDVTDAQLSINGFDSFEDYLRSGSVELLQYWGNVYDPETGEFYKNKHIIVADRMFILLNEDIDGWTYNKPIVMSSWRKLADNIYGQGPLYQLAGMQYRVDHLENAKADIFDQIIHPVVIIKGDSVEDFTFGPGVQIHVGSDGDVIFDRPDANALGVNNEIAYYHSMMEEMAGAPKEMMGFRTPGEKTAFEVQTLQQGSDRFFMDKSRAFEQQIIQPLLNMMFELIVRNLSVPDIVKVFNDDTKSETLVSITKEDVTATGVLHAVGTSHYEARNKRVRELQNVLQLVAAYPDLQNHFSAVNAGKLLEEELGTEKYKLFQEDIGIRERANAQMTAQIIQQQMQIALGQGATSGQTGPNAQQPTSQGV